MVLEAGRIDECIPNYLLTELRGHHLVVVDRHQLVDDTVHSRAFDRSSQ
ncbi:hypothetical protein A3Q41_04055 [Rhodococcoides fascians]|uniref:Uncharacterized protein n=1 Tax=Rhodococcoides fascians TaxID=1828 RepID=A0A143QRB5_RHOFA|nr:hypothetical protein A3Q41_04055 [Rhodococcus fascians]